MHVSHMTVTDDPGKLWDRDDAAPPGANVGVPAGKSGRYAGLLGGTWPSGVDLSMAVGK